MTEKVERDEPIIDDVDPLDNHMQEIEEEPETEDRLPQAREVILPVNMRAGKDYAQLGDAIFDPETESLVVKFNTKAGRDIAELIGSGVLTGILFGGQMQRNSATNKLN
ncbi:hypothetical protein PBI_STARLORD_63 [Arthrobacter phage StarLord]|nr:hypothetical protein PBI_STARLORD_63 [Arthrobacter phage StarLord]